jgi:SAM-dependent methyltransferase
MPHNDAENNATQGDAAYQERLAREAEFHDHSFEHDIREAEVGKYYAVTKRSYDTYRRRLFREPAGDVLEYGCGINSDGPELVRRGARVTGIDISPVAIAESTERARAAGLDDRLTYLVMNAEQLAFPDASFDLVCGIGIIHHLDVARSYAEIERVLRPGGRAVFLEPLGHNPLINRYRDRTPHLRTPDEHPLLRADIELARRHFSDVEMEFFHLTSLGIVPLRNTPLFKPLLALADGFDKVIMSVIPPLKWWGWSGVMEMRKRKA